MENMYLHQCSLKETANVEKQPPKKTLQANYPSPNADGC